MVLSSGKAQVIRALHRLLKSYRHLSEHLHSNISYWRSGDHISSFPGSCAREEEREPGTHCSHVLCSLGNLHTTGQNEHAFFSTHTKRLGMRLWSQQACENFSEKCHWLNPLRLALPKSHFTMHSHQHSNRSVLISMLNTTSEFRLTPWKPDVQRGVNSMCDH